MENNLINYGVRNLTSRLAISKNLFFYMVLSIIFTKYTRNGLKKL